MDSRIFGTANTVSEARAWAAAGANTLSMQGSEAAGHRSTFLHNADDAMIGSFSLLPLAVRTVDIPVIAAGGIMDGAGLIAAEALGAAGSQRGTAFPGCPECSAADA